MPDPETTMTEAEDAGADRVMRLRQVVDMLGGIRKAARHSGVAPGTLTDYLAGGGMKLGPLAQLAEAAGVQFTWLATGEEPMQVGQPAMDDLPAQPNGAAPPRSARPENRRDNGLGLAWQVNPDRIARAYEMALNGLATSPGGQPHPRRLMQVTLLLYDELTDAEQAATEPPATTP